MALNDKMTHGVSVTYIQNILIDIMQKSDDCAWPLDYLSRIIFKNQEIRNSHNTAVSEILRAISLPSGWVLLTSKGGPTDPILYNINNKESCKIADFLLMRSNGSNIYKKLFTDFVDYENRLDKQREKFVSILSINETALIKNSQIKRLNTKSELLNAHKQIKIQKLIDSIDVL